MRYAVALVALVGPLLPSCAYFNTLYNAERLYDEAERARARGEDAAADRAYRESAEKAAKSLHSDPDGAWADDALYLLARAHFGLGDEPAAVAAFERLLLATDDSTFEAGAHAYLGAIRIRDGHEAAALTELDAVLRQPRLPLELVAFARLWRARARFALGNGAGAWQDLEDVAEYGGALGREAWLEIAGRAVGADSTRRARLAFAELLGEPEARRWADTLRALAEAAFQRWGAGPARLLLEPAVDAPWPAGIRDALALYRAELAAAGGDTATAVSEARAVAARGAPEVADRARVIAARWRLAEAASPAEIRDVRPLLLPAVGHPEARALLQSLETLETLLERTRESDRLLGLFAAAELARDELGAHRLARDLFIGYADAAPNSAWAPKALLAAAALDPPPAQGVALRQRLAYYEGSVYLAALAGRAEAGRTFRRIEEDLAESLSVLRGEAAREVLRRDAAIAHAVFVRDSVEAATAGSSATGCAAAADSLMGADSLLAAGSQVAAGSPVPTFPERDTVVDAPRVDRPAPAPCPRADSLPADTLGAPG